jgi:hypothetical protein
MPNDPLTNVLGALDRVGFAVVRGPLADVERAWAIADEIVARAAEPEIPIEVIGEFVVPPPDGAPSRDFQTLHIDFGLPLIPGAPVDIARFTTLYIRADAAPVNATTRLVSLRSLLSAAQWPARDELLQRFAAYGESHGAWESERGYVEGSLARIVEAAQGQRPVLPSVKTTVGFRCGLEFTALGAELAFFAERGLPLRSAEDEVRLAPGQLLVFDNLAVAHGRRGQRRPGELHQRVFGDRATLPERQIELRDRALAALW